ncbi:hypothetical protein PAXRUDRAFT_478878 [Paxillus rubicundulus Ve08.2h10]|uniref:Uncharacterized protein n=1 Tax=Paxillus rubicundulus Ve08.2h10 TaxID=930991 RepID=A0A0D0DPT1_9AGAM|nr:hypothetical protein PAXRUDRAFT_478878 [Paxillus rubicundulus Ve08.2h10]
MELYLSHIWLIHWFGYTVYNALSHFTSRTAPVPLHVRQPPGSRPCESCIRVRVAIHPPAMRPLFLFSYPKPVVTYMLAITLRHSRYKFKVWYYSLIGGNHIPTSVVVHHVLVLGFQPPSRTAVVGFIEPMIERHEVNTINVKKLTPRFIKVV